MKKYLFVPFAAAGLIMASCTNEDLLDGTTGTAGNVVFSVELPAGIQSRAYSQAENADQLQFAVYDAQGNHLADLDQEAIAVTNLKATVTLNLVEGKDYQIVFWADNSKNNYYSFDKGDATITVASTTDVPAASQDDKRDAFFANYTFTVTGPINEPIYLTRPFAQINIGTSDYVDFTNSKETISQSGMQVKGANVLNLLNGSVSGDQLYIFSNADFPTEAFPYKSDDANVSYTYMAMDYLLVGNDKTTVDVTWTSNNSIESQQSVTFNSVPVQRNYRTNIFGALLTDPASFAVEIKPGYDNEDENNSEYDEYMFRVAKSLTDAQSMLTMGVPAVVIDGSLLTPSAAKQVSRADGVAEFLLNKTVEHQTLRIKGLAAADVKVSYAPVASGSQAVAEPEFTLILDQAKGVEIDLEGADVEIASGTKGQEATVESLTLTNAASTSLPEEVVVEEVTTGDNFQGELQLPVSSVEDLKNAIAMSGKIEVTVKADLDLTSTPALRIANDFTLNIAPGVTITTLRKDGTDGGQFIVEEGGTMTLNGGEGKMYGDGRIVDAYGTLVVNNGYFETYDTARGSVFMANEGGSVYINGGTLNASSTALWVNGYCEMNGGTILGTQFVGAQAVQLTGTFVLNDGTMETRNQCFYIDGNGQLEMNGGLVKSTSSYAESSTYYGYAIRVRSTGCHVVINDGEVEGVHGALGAYAGKFTVNGGYFHTHPRVNGSDNYYAMYVADEDGECVINGGKFYAENRPDVYIVSNHGKYQLKGGMFEDKGKVAWGNDNEATIPQGELVPAEGYQWTEVSGDPIFKYQVTAE